MSELRIVAGKRYRDVKGSVDFLKETGISSATKNLVRGAINSGAVPCIKLGRKFYVAEEQWLSFLAKNERRRR